MIDEKLQCNFNRKIAKISALSAGENDKSEYNVGEETLPFNRCKIIEQAKFTYSLLEKTFERQNKTKQKKQLNIKVKSR